MNKIVLGLTIVSVLGLGIYGFTRLPDSKENMNNSNNLTFSDVQAGIETGNSYLYDVRTSEEFSGGHFIGAKNFDLERLLSGQFPVVSKESTIYVYCRSGNRSSQAKSLLEKAGFNKIIDLGGLSDVEGIGGTLTN